MDQLSAIMALKVRGRHYADNIGRCDILFQSFRHFQLHSLFSEVIIVIPGTEQDYIRAYSEAWSDFPIRFIVEDDYLDKFKQFTKLHEVRSWHRQQIIKLFCAQLVQNEFFLVLDPDVFAVKSFRYSDVIVDQRAIIESDHREWHKDWWHSSASLLGVEPNLDRPSIGVTPTILSRDGCIALTQFISERYGKVWYEVLLSKYMTQWTEYTLYQLFLEHTGQFEKYHVSPDAIGLGTRLHSPAPWGVWKSGDYERLDVATLFSPKNPGLFTVIQSNVGIGPKQIAKDLGGHLPLKVQAYSPQSARPERLKEAYGAVVRKVMHFAQRYIPAPIRRQRRRLP